MEQDPLSIDLIDETDVVGNTTRVLEISNLPVWCFLEGQEYLPPNFSFNINLNSTDDMLLLDGQQLLSKANAHIYKNKDRITPIINEIKIKDSKIRYESSNHNVGPTLAPDTFYKGEINIYHEINYVQHVISDLKCLVVDLTDLKRKANKYIKKASKTNKKTTWYTLLCEMTNEKNNKWLFNDYGLKTNIKCNKSMSKHHKKINSKKGENGVISSTLLFNSLKDSVYFRDDFFTKYKDLANNFYPTNKVIIDDIRNKIEEMLKKPYSALLEIIMNNYIIMSTISHLREYLEMLFMILSNFRSNINYATDPKCSFMRPLINEDASLLVVLNDDQLNNLSWNKSKERTIFSKIIMVNNPKFQTVVRNKDNIFRGIGFAFCLDLNNRWNIFPTNDKLIDYNNFSNFLISEDLSNYAAETEDQ